MRIWARPRRISKSSHPLQHPLDLRFLQHQVHEQVFHAADAPQELHAFQHQAHAGELAFRGRHLLVKGRGRDVAGRGQDVGAGLEVAPLIGGVLQHEILVAVRGAHLEVQVGGHRRVIGLLAGAAEAALEHRVVGSALQLRVGLDLGVLVHDAEHEIVIVVLADAGPRRKILLPGPLVDELLPEQVEAGNPIRLPERQRFQHPVQFALVDGHLHPRKRDAGTLGPRIRRYFKPVTGSTPEASGWRSPSSPRPCGRTASCSGRCTSLRPGSCTSCACRYSAHPRPCRPGP